VALGGIAVNGFYAAGDTRTPTWVGVVSYTVYLPIKIVVFFQYGLLAMAICASGHYMPLDDDVARLDGVTLSTRRPYFPALLVRLRYNPPLHNPVRGDHMRRSIDRRSVVCYSG